MSALHWLIHSTSGFFVRVMIGVAIFVALAIGDVHRNGRHATRWREYLFLLLCVALAIVYGVINDQITSRISWEYFFYGKELDRVLGPATPPDPAALHRHAAIIGAEATWSAGLIIGVALLLANNPRRDWPRLAYSQLAKALAMIFVCCATFGILFGLAGYHGLLDWMSEDFGAMVREDMFRPRRFIAAWGVHLGGYVGGLVGTIAAVVWILRARKRLR